MRIKYRESKENKELRKTIKANKQKGKMKD
jgi:hypothetical protein